MSEQDKPEKFTIILYPEYEELKRTVEKLRTELSMLVLERDELLYITCKNIEMVYLLKLGGLEYKAYELQCEAARLKRKLELMQIHINRQEEIDFKTIEITLDIEFREYQEKLDEQIHQVNDAIDRSKREILTDEESKELKKLYRSIVKALHPDMNPNLTEAQKQLFQNAVAAYKDCNLTALRIIADMLSDPDLPDDTEDAIALLKQEKERLENAIRTVQADIIKIKSEYPYTLKDIIDDDVKIEERRTELEKIIKAYQDVIKQYKKRIKELTR